MATQIPKNVIIKEEKMQKLSESEMKCIEGGTGVTATMLNAVYKLIDVIYNIGDSLGSFIRRKAEGQMCDL